MPDGLPKKARDFLTKFDPDFRTARLSTHKEIASLKGPNGLSQFRPFFHKELN